MITVFLFCCLIQIEIEMPQNLDCHLFTDKTSAQTTAEYFQGLHSIKECSEKKLHIIHTLWTEQSKFDLLSP